MNIYFNEILLNVRGQFQDEIYPSDETDFMEREFIVDVVTYNGENVTKIYDSLGLIPEIAEICKMQIIYGKN
jgi:hypothetical protein